MKLLGVLLIVVGLVGLAYGGISWTRKDTVIDAGPVEVTADRNERVPIPPVLGGISLVAGIGLLVMGSRS